MDPEEIIVRLRCLGDADRLKGMGRYGIQTGNALGVTVPELRALAKEIGRNHGIASFLMDSGLHEVMILATMIEEPDKVTDEQMEDWTGRFDSWDLCDQCCNNLYRHMPCAWRKALEWCDRDEEFVRRAGFTMIAVLAVHDREARDEDFQRAFAAIERHSADGRNFVKKAVNWALRQIGKRNAKLNAEAIALGEIVLKKGDRSSVWVATDALKELRSEPVQQRLKNRQVG